MAITAVNENGCGADCITVDDDRRTESSYAASWLTEVTDGVPTVYVYKNGPVRRDGQAGSAGFMVANTTMDLSDTVAAGDTVWPDQEIIWGALRHLEDFRREKLLREPEQSPV